MAFKCPKCGRRHRATEFQNDHRIHCQCGFKVDDSHLQTVDDFVQYFENEDERKRAQEIKIDAEAICRMILFEYAEEVDVEIAKGKLREKVARLFPDKMETYDMIYESRFKRLWQQFRGRQP